MILNGYRKMSFVSVKQSVRVWGLSKSYFLFCSFCSFSLFSFFLVTYEFYIVQLLSFSKKFGTDLSEWEDDGAWPCVIDDFVDTIKKE